MMTQARPPNPRLTIGAMEAQGADAARRIGRTLGATSRPEHLREAIEPLLHLRQVAAAAHLGISVSKLKALCRVIGIIRWRYARNRASSAPTLMAATECAGGSTSASSDEEPFQQHAGGWVQATYDPLRDIIADLATTETIHPGWSWTSSASLFEPMLSNSRESPVVHAARLRQCNLLPPCANPAHYCPAVESLLQQAAGGAQTDPPGRSLVARSSWSSDPLALLQSLPGSAKAVPWCAGSNMSQGAATSGPPAATTTRPLLQGGQELLLPTRTYEASVPGTSFNNVLRHASSLPWPRTW